MPQGRAGVLGHVLVVEKRAAEDVERAILWPCTIRPRFCESGSIQVQVSLRVSSLPVIIVWLWSTEQRSGT